VQRLSLCVLLLLRLLLAASVGVVRCLDIYAVLLKAAMEHEREQYSPTIVPAAVGVELKLPETPANLLVFVVFGTLYNCRPFAK
jgi:hypothetical protein